MTAETPERLYSFTKLAAGDYLLPANNGRDLWRFKRYTDGPSQGLDWPRDRDVWAAWKWEGAIGADGTMVRYDAENLDNYVGQADTFDTRAEAVAWALRRDAGR